MNLEGWGQLLRGAWGTGPLCQGVPDATGRCRASEHDTTLPAESEASCAASHGQGQGKVTCSAGTTLCPQAQQEPGVKYVSADEEDVLSGHNTPSSWPLGISAHMTPF